MKKSGKALSAVLLSALLCSAVFMTGTAAGGPQGTLTALPTASAVFVNGAPISFQAYNISDYNYFKLRDLAKALDGTEKQFEVSYDGTGNKVFITTGKAYTAVGGELAPAGDMSIRQALVSGWTVYVDGVKVGLSAYLIDGYNYFKLRDIAAAVGFGVTYNEDTTDIDIDTGSGYTGETGDSEEPGESEGASNPLIGSWRLDLPPQGTGSASKLYLIFSDNGRLTQFIGSEVATYTADEAHIYVTKVKVVTSDTYDYTVTVSDNRTTLNVESTQFGLMEREGVPTETGAGLFYGLWLSRNESFNDDTYFYFTKDGSILMGVTLSGEYTISDSGDAFTDNITPDGSPETKAFEVRIENGVTVMITTDGKGRQTTMYKE